MAARVFDETVLPHLDAAFAQVRMALEGNRRNHSRIDRLGHVTAGERP